jgi:hypothetical protein
MPSFRRQATALKLAYCHAIMHANRPFLLGNTKTSNVRGQASALDDSVAKCMSAAKGALETVDSIAEDVTLFHAFWWMPYVTFCALAVVYVWKIQQSMSGSDVTSLRDHALPGLFDLTERCQIHLARATAADSPSRRYSVILEELRLEAKYHSERQTRSSQTLNYSEQALGLSEESGEQNQQGEEAITSLQGMNDSSISQEAYDSSQQGGGFYGMPNLLNMWQPTDWLDLDSSVGQPPRDFDL